MRPPRIVLLCVLTLGACAGCRATPDSPPAATPAASGGAVLDATRARIEVHIDTGSGQPLRVRAEVARTAAERSRGLMYREHLGADEGMLFLMPGDDDWTFYMKNTLIPLDMLFADPDGVVVGVIHEARPLDESLLSVGHPSRYVLELPGGSARRLGIGAGARLSWPGGPTPPSRAP